jgi:hypothetical protein
MGVLSICPVILALKCVIQGTSHGALAQVIHKIIKGIGWGVRIIDDLLDAWKTVQMVSQDNWILFPGFEIKKSRTYCRQIKTGGQKKREELLSSPLSVTTMM